jgi:hypothetical protein
VSTRVDVEEIEVTRGERLLAVVLASFLLLGGLWGYFELNLADDEPAFREPTAELSAPQRATLERRVVAEDRAATARRRVRNRRQALVDRREAYRTALDEGRRAPALASRYRQAQDRYDAALAVASRRNEQAREARAAARPVEAELSRIERAQTEKAEDEQRRDELLTAGLRLALVLGLLAGALRLMAWQRRRRSRWVLVGYASVAAAGVLALVMGVDYLTDWFDPVDLGPLVLSIVGAAFTLVALGALQRHLARRLPGRRVRRGECPFCGYPTGHGEHCEGCGRTVVAPCARCREPRRVGTAHCAACGQV